MSSLTVDDLSVGEFPVVPLREWLVCGTCDGSGEIPWRDEAGRVRPDGSDECRDCGGSGFNPDKVMAWCIEHDRRMAISGPWECADGEWRGEDCRVGWVPCRHSTPHTKSASRGRGGGLWTP